MHPRLEGLALGLIGGIAGLAAMELAQRLTKPLVRSRAPRPTDVFQSERSMSLVGLHHHEDESATDAIGRLGYEKLLHRVPSEKAKRALSWAVHLGYGLAMAGLYGALRASGHPPWRRHRMTALRDGAIYGAALWLVGDELVMPLLGFADKPTQYHPTQHLQSLAAHLGYGVATAAATDALRHNGFRHNGHRRMS